ncbi:hypothetical protein [Meiothermus hypogaeus]|uniref:Uncharacterized protein n=2 Tax=Meiothermus hypogaeus TaxID=884155 RepID=A0A511R2V7_9DEIN|nr:hypothetical protein [Meiothermus hypogaeus]RIH74596.1 hypothetical protein Mhypo_03273 [Meiothermus hypogaeus]GEM83925.1 hypothetical protein MHY01S_20910 [Meiothermus hypogaeus NBRC 106114]
MDSVTQNARLEKALQIALCRVHGGDVEYVAQLISYLEDDAEASDYAPCPYQGWQDARRLINEIEALEVAQGIEHVKVIWEANLAAYESRKQNIQTFFELELFEERLTRYRIGGV